MARQELVGNDMPGGRGAIERTMAELLPDKPTHDWNVTMGRGLTAIRLTMAEEEALGTRADGGLINHLGQTLEVKASELALRNWRLMRVAFKLLRHKDRLSQADEADLWQAGFTDGLMFAAKNYDPDYDYGEAAKLPARAWQLDEEGVLDSPSQGGAFSSYAIKSAWGRMRRYRDQYLTGTPVDLGVTGQHLHALFREMEWYLTNLLNETPTWRLVAVATSMMQDSGRREGSSLGQAWRPTLDQVLAYSQWLEGKGEGAGGERWERKVNVFRNRQVQYRDLTGAVETKRLDRVQSIQLMDPAETGEMVMFEVDGHDELADGKEENNPEAALTSKKLREAITGVLGDLAPKEVTVLEMRFGLKDGQEHTLEEVGKYLGVTREWVRLIEGKALRKLRHPTKARFLRDYLR